MKTVAFERTISVLKWAAEIILVVWAVLMHASVFYVQLQVRNSSGFNYRLILLYCVLALIVLYAAENGGLVLALKAWLVPIAINITGLIQAMFFPDNISALTENIYYPVLLLLVLMMVMSRQNVREITGIFVAIMVGLAAVSLVFYFGCTVFKVIPMKATAYYWGGNYQEAKTFLNIYYEAPKWQPIRFLGIHGSRNIGMFTESPMYAFLLVTALLMNRLFHVLDRKCNWILLITIVTTFSVTSVIALFLFYVLYYCLTYRKKIFSTRWKRIFFFAAAAAAVLFFVRLLAGKMQTRSAAIRTDHLRACFQVIHDTFPLGCGTANWDFIVSYETRKQGMSVGLPAFLALDGVFAVIVFLIPTVWYFACAIKRRRITDIAFVCAFMVVIFMTALTYSYIVWFIVVMVFEREIIDENAGG